MQWSFNCDFQSSEALEALQNKIKEYWNNNYENCEEKFPTMQLSLELGQIL